MTSFEFRKKCLVVRRIIALLSTQVRTEQYSKGLIRRGRKASPEVQLRRVEKSLSTRVMRLRCPLCGAVIRCHLDGSIRYHADPRILPTSRVEYYVFIGVGVRQRRVKRYYDPTKPGKPPKRWKCSASGSPLEIVQWISERLKGGS